MHCTGRSILSGLLAVPAPRASSLPPAFLLPAFPAAQSTASFSSSVRQLARKDGNPARGVSAIRRTGVGKKQKLSVRLENLPKPVLDPSKRSKVEVDEDHGLWGFFNNDHSALMKPEEYHSHGRAWTVQELRLKGWEDMHKLWWLCVKEKNRIRTYEMERERLKAGYGQYEADLRLEEIRKTMKAIKQTLTEQWYTWENACSIAEYEDEEIDLSEKGAFYAPKPYDSFEAAPLSSGSERASVPGNGKSQSEVRA